MKPSPSKGQRICGQNSIVLPVASGCGFLLPGPKQKCVVQVNCFGPFADRTTQLHTVQVLGFGLNYLVTCVLTYECPTFQPNAQQSREVGGNRWVAFTSKRTKRDWISLELGKVKKRQKSL